MSSTSWKNLEHKIWKQDHLQKLIEDKRLLLAVSGGVDSIVLLHVFNNLKSVLNFEIICAHVHHGFSANEQILKFRNDSKKIVKDNCQDLGIQFELAESLDKYESLKSEDDFRTFRYHSLSEIKQKFDCDYIVTAHHAQDQLETRLIHLIRGSGEIGLLGMKLLDNERLRPFLILNKSEISDYAAEAKLNWVEDVTNTENHYFRNWIRNEWLESLECRVPGSVSALARSLENLSEYVRNNNLNDLSFENGIFWVDFLKMTSFDQKRSIVLYLNSIGVRELSHSQVLEILKYLDRSEKEHTFSVAKCVFRINAERIIAEKQS